MESPRSVGRHPTSNTTTANQPIIRITKPPPHPLGAPETRISHGRDCRSRSYTVRTLPGPPLGDELPLVERAKLLERGGLARGLVLADARDASEAQRQARAV